MESWQSPEDAFEPLVNAYVYRGSVNKRNGYQECGFTGLLRYQNNQIANTGDGINTSYNLQLSKFPVVPGSITVTTLVGAVKKSMTDVPGIYPAGTFIGTLNGVSSAINYFTGTISLVASGIVDLDAPIVVQYTFTNSQTAETLGTGNGVTLAFGGTLSSIPVVPLSLEITTTTLAGATIIQDDGKGNLVGEFVAPTSVINYTTGVWNILFTSPVVNATLISSTYIQVGDGSPIMGINHFENETTGSDLMTVEDQKRMATFNNTTKLFDPVQKFKQTFYFVTSSAATATVPATITLPFTNLAPYSVSVFDGTNTITDIPGTYPNGGFTGSATLLNTSTIDYATSTLTIKFNAYAAASATTPITLTVTATLQGDYFTGGDDDFFKYANWKANDTEAGYLYLTNNKDRVTLYNGITGFLSRPAFPILDSQIQPQINGILRTLDIKVYKNRLLMFSPTVLQGNNSITEHQVVRYSSEFYTFGTNKVIPFDFVADISGHGGVADAPTPDWIICAEFLRDAIVTYFQKTTWLFRFTGAATGTIFRWDQINSSRTSNAPYGSLDYDGNTTSMGTKGLIACDGVNVDRYDTAIIDQYTDIDNDNFIQCQAIRDDILNQSWMTYPSTERNVGNRFCDTAIIYNFLEENFATYEINTSALGVENTYQDITWQSFAPASGIWTEGLTWEEADFNWNKFTAQNLSPQVFAGDQNGYVYIMNVTETDNGGHIDVQIKSKRWNPFIQSGERCRFGYIDFYYQITPDVTLQVDIFNNNSKNPDITKYLTLNGPANDDFAWKRLQVNLQGEFIRIQITTPFIPAETINQDQENDIANNGTFLISGIILWAMPAGRLTPGIHI